MSFAGAIAGVGDRAHEENLLTLQREHEARTNMVNLALKSLETLPEQLHGPIMQELVNFTSDPHYKADKFAKKMSQYWTTPIQTQTQTQTPTLPQPPQGAPVPGASLQTMGPQINMQAAQAAGMIPQVAPPPPSGGEGPLAAPIPPPPGPPIGAAGPMTGQPLPIPAPPEVMQAGTTKQMVSPQAAGRMERAANAVEAEKARYAAQYDAQEEARRRGEAQRLAQGREMGLEGDDLANFVINKTIRDRTTGSAFKLVTGTMDGKPAYAWQDPTGLLREYTPAGPGAPLPAGKFLPKESGSETTFNQVVEARQRIAQGKGTPEDQETVKAWGEMHRPPAPTTIYIPGLGIVDKKTGNTVAKIDVPTSTTRTMSEAAPKVINFVDRIMPMIDAQAKSLGPAASRWNEFMTGKVGAPNPDFMKLRTNVNLLTTLLLRMHVGARGGQQMMDHFKELMDVSKQSPENLRAALEEIKIYAQDVAAMKNQGASNPPPPGETGGPKPGTVEGGYRFKGGDPADKKNWEKVAQ